MSFWINAAIWAIIIGVGMWRSKPKPLTAAFIVSVYVGLETYFYVSHWLSYLPTGLHILFMPYQCVCFMHPCLSIAKRQKLVGTKLCLNQLAGIYVLLLLCGCRSPLFSCSMTGRMPKLNMSRKWKNSLERNGKMK